MNDEKVAVDGDQSDVEAGGHEHHRPEVREELTEGVGVAPAAVQVGVDEEG